MLYTQSQEQGQLNENWLSESGTRTVRQTGGPGNLSGSTQSHSEMWDAQLAVGTQPTLILFSYIALLLASDVFLYGQSSCRHSRTLGWLYCLDIFSLQRNNELLAKA